MALQLHQLIAVAKTKRQDAETAKTQTYQTIQKIQKKELFEGFRKTYRAFDEPTDGSPVVVTPPQEKLVTTRVDAQLDVFKRAMVDLVDTVATIDRGNTVAKADITIGGTFYARDVPVTTLLFLEKQATDLHTYLSKLPVLDSDAVWKRDNDLDLFKTEPTMTISTRKSRNVVTLAPATDKHPAQVQVFEDAVPCGEWATVRLSAAVPAARKAEMLSRARQIMEAIQVAREAANTIEVPKVNIGDALYEFVMGV